VLAVGCWVLGGAAPGLSLAADSVVFRRHTDPTATDQVIVKWRDSGVAAVQIASIEERTARLRSVTGGQGAYTMEFSHYAPVPPQTQQHLASQFKLEREED